MPDSYEPESMTGRLLAGCVAVDVTPRTSQFLWGYPHVERYSTGTLDSLCSSALYLRQDDHSLLFIANDVVFVTADLTARVRSRIAAKTSLSPSAIMVTATHTHSGPMTVSYLSNAADPVVPDPDPDYLQQLEDGMVAAALAAVAAAESAEAGLVMAEAAGIGGNRRDPNGPSQPSVPVLAVRSRKTGKTLGLMPVVCMHPTVLHEDSTLCGGDFPGFARHYLQERFGGCPVVYHTGPSGNQSPRHAISGNTVAEARRLGALLGAAIATALQEIEWKASLPLCAQQLQLALTPRETPSLDTARAALALARANLAALRDTGAPATTVRTAECDLFGAEELVTLAEAAQDGRLAAACAERSPAEIQILTLGPWPFIGWPGEFFVEYGLQLQQKCPGAVVITLANGELQGYIATKDATGYEAANAVFDAANGQHVVAATLRALSQVHTCGEPFDFDCSPDAGSPG